MAERGLAPGPRSWSLLGQGRAFRRNPLEYLTWQHRRFGDFSRFRLLNAHAYLLAHPDYIRDLLLQHSGATVKSMALQRAKSLLGEGLLTSEPPLHTRQRRLMQPAFHQERLLRYATIMICTGEEWLRRWDDMRLADRAFDLHGEMMQLTLSIVVRALFSSDLAPVAYELSQLTTLVVRMFPYLISPFGEYVEHWPLPVSRRYKKARERLDSLIYGLIGERRAGKTEGDDLLSMLLAAQDQESAASDARMTDRQIRDELITLFLAGHETTANALAWTWYLLSRNPEVEARFHQEIDQVLPAARLASRMFRISSTPTPFSLSQCASILPRGRFQESQSRRSISQAMRFLAAPCVSRHSGSLIVIHDSLHSLNVFCQTVGRTRLSPGRAFLISLSARDLASA